MSAGQWQTIETLPTDGQMVVVWEQWGDHGQYKIVPANGSTYFVEVAYWMPLPAPPTS